MARSLRDKVRDAEAGVVRYAPGYHPNSVAALAAHAFPLRHDLARRCERCGRPAVRGNRWCYSHSRRGQANPSEGALASRTLSGMYRRGLLPPELMSLPTWRALSACPVAARAPLRIALVRAWDTRELAPLAWAALWREAVRMANAAPPSPHWRKRGPALWMDAA